MSIERITADDEAASPAVSLQVKKDRFDVRVDTQLTPLYCHRCEAQVPGLFRLNGSRYGQVGSITCDCGAVITCVGSDNIVEWLDTITHYEDRELGRLRIDYYQLYCLAPSYWELLREKTGFDVLDEFNGQKTTLADIVHLLETRYQLRPEGTLDKHPLFQVLPAVVAKWVGILGRLRV